MLWKANRIPKPPGPIAIGRALSLTPWVTCAGCFPSLDLRAEVCEVGGWTDEEGRGRSSACRGPLVNSRQQDSFMAVWASPLTERGGRGL